MEKFTNSLIHESSPYLLQHAHNPVNWYPWGGEALKKARDEDKLILISVGYSSCHWCHVMAHESFEDEDIARIMNERYVCIKIDREERPDIDQIYMNAVQLMTGQGGWPLNCFTLPDQRPVYGGTYFPPDDWKRLLMNLDGFFREKRPEAEAYAEKLTAGVRQSERVPVFDQEIAFGEQDLREVYTPWQQYFDHEEGGHARAPKFPLPNNFLFLLRYAHHLGEASAGEIVRLTLDKMCRGGIYDQLGGGFSRYSVDAQWHVPHFEKMLYDNGQLVSLYAEAYTWCGEPLYRQTVYETLDFVEREMTSPEGGFYSALDADSEGVEGKFYVWTAAEVEEAGLDRPDIFLAYYNITVAGNWEGTNVLRRLHSDEEVARRHDITREELRRIIDDGKERLMRIRAARVRPGLDDKILASWNGIMLKGYLDAFRAFGDERFLSAALRNARFLKEQLIGEEGRIFRNYKSGRATIEGFLDDHAFVASAFISLYEATFDETWLDEARRLADRTLSDFYHPETGMFFYTAAQGEALIDRKYELMDNVMPSSNSVMAHVLYRLGLFFDRDEYFRISRRMLGNVMASMKSYGSAWSNWALLLQQEVAGMYEVAVTAPAGGDASVEELRRELDRAYIPNKVLLGGTSGTLPLLEGKFADRPMVYVCRNKTCRLPVTDAASALAQMTDAMN